jgi:hypothetical protein
MSLISILLLCLFQSNTANAQQAKVAMIGFYNLENLFDTIDAPDILDEEFLPNGKNKWNTEKYTKKLKNMSSVIAELGTEISPDGVAILGISEIENRGVVEDLLKQPALQNRGYKIVHYDSPDRRGVDVGLIYQPKYFTVTAAESLPVLIYNDNGDRIYTRDILHVTGLLDNEELHILVNHWPSRRGGEASSAPLRNAAADVCRKLFDSLAVVNPNVNFIVMGDLNDDPIDASIKNHLKAHGTKEKVKKANLFDPMTELYKKGNGTLAHNDTWGLFDQIIVSYGLLNDGDNGFQLYKPVIYNKKYLVQKTGNFIGYPFRTFDGDLFIEGYSDHFPVYLVFTKKI